MAEKMFTITPPTGRAGKAGLGIPLASLQEVLNEDEIGRKTSQTIKTDYGIIEIMLSEIPDKREKRRIVAKVYVERRKSFEFLALDKKQSHLVIEEGKVYRCVRTNLRRLTPLDGIDIYTIRILEDVQDNDPQDDTEQSVVVPSKEKQTRTEIVKPEEAEGNADTATVVSLRRSGNKTFLTLPDEKTARLASDAIGGGWYRDGNKLIKLYFGKPTVEEETEEEKLRISLPEKIKQRLAKIESIEEQKQKQRKIEQSKPRKGRPALKKSRLR